MYYNTIPIGTNNHVKRNLDIFYVFAFLCFIQWMGARIIQTCMGAIGQFIPKNVNLALAGGSIFYFCQLYVSR